MLDLKFVVANENQVIKSLENRNFQKAKETVGALVSQDKKRKECIVEVETLKAQRNRASEEISAAKKEKKDASQRVEEMRAVSQKIKELDEVLRGLEDQIHTQLLHIPNVLSEKVPVGKDAESNVVVREWGTKAKFDFEPKAHFEIGTNMGILDFDRAAKVSGARFVFLRGLAAKMERALAQFMLDTHASRGYEEIFPPFLVNSASCVGTGQLPKFAAEIYKIDGADFYMVPTAEVPVTNFFKDEILEESGLPVRFCAYSSCFRSEAGAAGKDTRGLKRQHQFQKVELVKFCSAETAAAELEKLLADAEHILQLLKLPYRVVSLCSGDIGFSSSFTYDIEVWSPFEKKFVEISSCSNFTDFQARRANIRYRRALDGKVAHVHTLNGSGLAVGRTLLAIIENYQTKDGKFTIPDALKGYLKA